MLLQLQITIIKHVSNSNPKPPNPKKRSAGPSSSFGLPRRAKGRRSERLRPGHIRRLRLRNVSAARPIRPSSLQRASEWVIKMGHKRPRQYPSSHAPELIASEPNISRAGRTLITRGPIPFLITVIDAEQKGGTVRQPRDATLKKN